MKDLAMLAGFGCGLVVGVMLYKYSKETKKMVDNSEKTVIEQAEKLEQKAMKGMEKAEEKIKQGAKKVEKKLKQAKSN